MNFIKRTWYSLLYRKKNTLLTILMFFVLGILVLSGLCIQDASQQSVQQIQQDVGAEIVISNVAPYYADYGVNGLTLSTVQTASGLTVVTGMDYSSELEATPHDFEPVWSEEQKAIYDGYDSILAAGEGNTASAEDFAGGGGPLSYPPDGISPRPTIMWHWSTLRWRRKTAWTSAIPSPSAPALWKMCWR